MPKHLYNIRNPDNPISSESQEALILERASCNDSISFDQNYDDSPCWNGKKI